MNRETHETEQKALRKGSRRGMAVIIIIAAFLIVLAAAAGIVFSKYALFGGALIRRDTDSLDLRGQALSEEQFSKASELFPQAHIKRDVNIGGKIYDADAADIAVGDVSAEEMERFGLFYDLQSVDASDCSSIERAAGLRSALPSVHVFWNAEIGGESYPDDSESISVPVADAAELSEKLGWLPALKTVSVGSGLSPAEQMALREQYPDLGFCWDVTLVGKSFGKDTTILDFSGTPLTEAELGGIEPYFALFPALQGIDFTDCGLTDETLFAFCDAHPELAVEWETSLFGVSFSTLDEEICFNDIPLTVSDAEKIEALLPYMPRLKKVVMCRCGIADEDMETINLRHDDVQFVWMVQLSNCGVRTDRTYFCVWNCDYTYPDNNLSFAGLKYCHDMIAIDLGHQKLYGDPDIFAGMPQLRYATLCDCAHEKLPTLSELKELVFLEMYWTNMDDISPLVELKNLKALNITYKRVRDRANDLEVLRQMTWLEKLYFSANMYSAEEIQMLREALPNTDIRVIETLNCCSLGWRSDNKYYYDYRDALHMYYISDESNHIDVNPFTGEKSQYDDTDPFR